MKQPVRNTLIPGIIAVFLVVVPALLIRAGMINAYYAQVLISAGINTIMAISVNVVVGITGQLSLGQAGFMAIGAYACMFFSGDLGLPLPLGLLLAALVAAFAGFLIGFPSLKLTGDYLAIVTLGFGEIIRVLLTNLKSITEGPDGKKFTTILQDINSGPFLSFLVVIGSLALIVVLLHNFLRSTYGRAIFAVREDEIAANSSGINIFRYKMIAFVIGAFIAGIGGSLYAMFIGFINPDMASFSKSIDYLIYVVLGGMGSMTGTIIATYSLYMLQEFLRFLQNYRLLIYPVILILVMIFRPQGLMGMKELSFVRLTRRFVRFSRKLLMRYSGKAE
ncbi:MAG: branched-chain amino acid ABC transporter permease [Spirochaetaceae bacterium]|jgi:branched-chain amino acid transport system permease protein|nr:branched-chain amino acid ABC transporter permease [Spirochaetaceae bacterium]